MSDDTELRDAARDLLRLYNRHPDLFQRVLPIGDDDLEALLELAEFDDNDEEPPDAAD